MWTDLRHSLRLLIRQPGFTAAACLTLAFGIGANAAMFSVVDAALLRPLPYRDADRLVTPVSRLDDDVVALGSSPDRVRVLRANAGVFDGLSGYSTATNMAPAGSDPSQAQWIGRLPPGFMEFLGVVPALGRTFTEEDVTRGDAAIISSSYWTRTFHRDRSAIGQQIVVKGRPYTIVGVAPPEFRYLVSDVQATDAWLSERVEDASHVVGRLRRGLTIPAAEHELGLALLHAPGFVPESWESHAPGFVPKVELWPAGLARARGLAKSAVFAMLAAVAIVLVIACANVANLLLGRTLTRQREIATRASLGATRWQIARLLLVEGLVLASTGGLVASAVAAWGLSAFPALVPTRLMAYSFFGVYTPSLDGRVMAFAAAAAIVTGLICGVVPALRAVGVAPALVAQSGLRIMGLTKRQRRVRDAFQSAQVAMAFVLVASAVVMTSSVLRMVLMPPGFAIAGLESARMSIPDKADRDAIYAALLPRARAIGGVEQATVGSNPASAGPGTFFAEGEAMGRDRGNLAVHYILPDYLSVVGLPLRVGRGIRPTDTTGAPLVALIDENNSRRHFPDGALGRRFKITASGPWITVVGVVGRVKTNKLDVTNAGEVYLPLAQNPAARESLLVRTSLPTATLLSDLRTAATAVDPRITVFSLAPVSESYSDVLAAPRFYLTLLVVFASLGLVTTVVGLYGLLTHAVARRTPEIGVRMALGADAGRTRRLVVAEALTPVVTGLAIGLFLAPAAGRWLTYDLFDVTTGDPATLALAVVAFLGFAALAAYAPARRATRIDPVRALASA